MRHVSLHLQHAPLSHSKLQAMIQQFADGMDHLCILCLPIWEHRYTEHVDGHQLKTSTVMTFLLRYPFCNSHVMVAGSLVLKSSRMTVAHTCLPEAGQVTKGGAAGEAGSKA